MRRALLVANPASSGFTGALYRDVVRALEEHFVVEPSWPIDTGEARDRAAEAAAAGFDVIIAMGGDGVIHHLANGLVGTGTPLGIVPAGTTNVLARIHGIPRNPRAAAEALHAARPVPAPLIRVGIDGGPTIHATFAVGAGFDADVVEVAERSPRSKLRFGSLHFARAAVGRVLGPYRSRQPSLDVDVDGSPVRATSVFVQSHGVYTYLGRLPIRLSRPGEDGPAALTAERIDPRLAARLVTRLIAHRDVSEIPGVEIWPDFARIRVAADEAFPIQADGEHLGSVERVEFSPVPGALVVLRH